MEFAFINGTSTTTRLPIGSRRSITLISKDRLYASEQSSANGLVFSTIFVEPQRRVFGLWNIRF